MNMNKNNNNKGFTIIELMISTVVFSLVLLAATAAITQIGKKYARGITFARTNEVTRSIVEDISQSLQFTSQSVKVPNYPDNDGDSLPDPTYNIFNAMFASQIVSASPLSSSDISVSSPDLSVPNDFYFCIGAKRYSFVLGAARQDDSSYVLWVDEPLDGCANAVDMGSASDSAFPGTNGKELLDRKMRITKLEIIPRTNGLWTINLDLATGDGDLLLYTYYTDSSGAPTGEGRVSCEGSILSSEFCATSETSINVSKRIQ
jgi:prepilin-type N-terminal cleavage/methylation domain-containing protein